MTMKIIRRKQNAAGEIWKDHVLARLKEPRCWICAQVVREVDRDLFWFASEQYYEPRVGMQREIFSWREIPNRMPVVCASRRPRRFALKVRVPCAKVFGRRR
jgi:hypothetical protein